MKTIIAFLILIISISSYSQDRHTVDSLKHELSIASSDTAKILLRSEIGFAGWILREGYWDSIAVDCRSFIKHSKQHHAAEVLVFKERLAAALMSIAYVKSNSGYADDAIKLYQETLIIQTELDNKDGIATILNNLANIYDDKGDIPKALEFYQNSMEIRVKIGDLSGVASTLNNLAYLYTKLEEYDMAIESFTESLEMSIELEDDRYVSLALNNLGYVYQKQGDLVKSEKYHQESLAIRIKIDDLKGIAMSNNMLGMVAKDNLEYNKALDFFKVSLKIYSDNNSLKGVGTTLSNIGETYILKGNYLEADKCIQQSLDIATELGYPLDIQIAAEMLTEINKQKGDWKKAIEMYELFILMKDSLKNIENNKLIIKQNLQKEYEKMTLADSLLTAEEKKVTDAEIETHKSQIDQEQTKRYALYGGLAIVILFGVFMFNRFLVSQKKNYLIQEQKEIVQEKNKEILDSINYAKRIQSAILPASDTINAYLKDYFILYKPKDIVAGDFYWLEIKNGKTLFAVADCTGHGVPGAMISVVCNNGLNRSVREHGLTDPGKILDKTREIVIQEFSKSGEEEMADGMDISLCSIEGNKMQWAGANNPLWIIRKGELLETLPNRQPIGNYPFPEPFLTHEITLEKDDRLYLLSDGFPDQFGGVKGKKYKVKNLKKLLISISHNPMYEQQGILNTVYEDWRADLEQIDDICILGLKI
jgi:serine phosphatase RsbU (regulator of sigma subunit)/tetratricopeptide (TPR) repeat protein